MLNDLRFAIRSLRRNPAFAAVAIITLALGIGANTALFSVADAVLFKPLPYPESARIVRIAGAPFSFTGKGMGVAPQMLRSRAFSAVGIYATGGLNVGGEPGAERLRAAAVSAGFFGALGAQLPLGRAFTETEVSTAERVAVISHALWNRRLGADRDVVGRQILLNGNPYAVVGVLPPRFDFPAQSDVWIPTGVDRQITGAAFAPSTIARLAPGVSLAQARDEVERINDVRRAGRPKDPRQQGVSVSDLRTELIGDVRPLLLVVAAAVFLVLLVSCLNTANLLLARLSAREREITIRTALGASRVVIGRYLLCESAVLALCAGVVAVPAAYWTLAATTRLLPAGIHGSQDIGIDLRAAAVTAALSLVSTLIFGLAPILSLHRSGATVLRAPSSTVHPFWRRFRASLVTAELAAAVVLLAAALGIVQVVSSLLAVDLGARGERALTMQLTLPRTQYPTAVEASGFFERLAIELEKSGLEGVGAASSMPGTTEVGLGIGIVAEGLVTADPDATATYVKASPGYFSALGIDVLAGRSFTDADNALAPAVAIISEGVAATLGEPLNQVVGRRRIDVSLGDKPEFATVVGVTRDVRFRGPEGPGHKTIYVPYRQSRLFGTLYVVAKARGEPRGMVEPVRAAIATVDPNLPPYNVRTFDEVRATYVADRTFAMRLMLWFAGLVASLSAIGLYGLMSYLVRLREREIGIRVALGATPGGVLRETMKGGLFYVSFGILVGTAAAVALSRMFISKVPGLQPVDPSTLTVTALVMLALATGTILIPSRRAARIDPVEALRTEG
jgi:predicted permease